MTYPIGITKGLATWQFQSHHVERVLDNAAYDAAHPDDTLLLAGPARRDLAQSAREVGAGQGSLLALGMFQMFSWNTTAPVQPLMAIGSGRSFYLRGKSQTQWQASRIMVNGRNLLRALYHSAQTADIDATAFDDPVINKRAEQFFTNLDSELYYIPIGLALIMRTKSHSEVAAMYFELCMIGSWSAQIQAGQALIAESITGLCDRVLPFNVSDSGEKYALTRSTLDQVLRLGATAAPQVPISGLGIFPDDKGLDTDAEVSLA
jgi:hypothetical protein